MPFLETLIPVLASGLSDLFRSNQQRDLQREQNAANMKLAEYQYGKDLEMWNRANVYNQPSMQMQRLRDAGLNPNLVASGGGSAGGTAAQVMPKYQAPGVSLDYDPPVNPLNMLMAYQDYRLKSAEAVGKETANEMLNSPSQVVEYNTTPGPDGVPTLSADITQGKYWKLLNALKLDRASAGLRMDKQKIAANLPRYQKDVLESNRFRVNQETQRLIQATRKLNLENDYFVAKAWTDMFGSAGRGIASLSSVLRRGRLGSARPSNTVRPNGLKVAPRVTPRTENGRKHPAWRVFDQNRKRK